MKQLYCSVGKEKAKRLVEVIWEGKTMFYPRCDRHITKDYEGVVFDLQTLQEVRRG